MKIRMLRNVLVDGQHCAAGDVVEVAERLGEVLVRMGRAERVGGQASAGDEVRVTSAEGGETPASQELETATRPAAQRRGKK